MQCAENLSIHKWLHGALMSERLPWFRFSPSDWLAGTAGMKAVEIAVYITLIALMYDRGSPLPVSEKHEKQMARRCGTSLPVFKSALSELVETGKILTVDGNLWNDRVDREMQYRETKSESGRKGAVSRWSEKDKKNKGRSDATALPPHSDRNAIRDKDTEEDKNYSSSSTREREPTPREILREILTEETTAAVMKHRQAKRAPLSTALAARGLVKGFLEYPAGPEAAAELMLTSGWTGFKREFWDKRPMAGGQRRMTAAEETGQRLAERIRELQNGGGQPAYSGGEGSDDLWGPQRLPANR